MRSRSKMNPWGKLPGRLCQRLRTVFFRPGIPPVGKLIGIAAIICNETATGGKSHSDETPSVLR